MSSNINQFIIDTNKEIKLQNKQVKEAKQVVLGAYSQILSKSPVATSLFKHNHLITVNSKTNATKDLSNNIAENNAKINMAKFNNGMTLTIQNNLLYSNMLESGHSSQAPEGVYGVTERLVQEY